MQPTVISRRLLARKKNVARVRSIMESVDRISSTEAPTMA